MDGEIIYFDAERGIGFITGRDGNRYVFDRADLAGADRVAKGVKVQFSIVGDRAREIQAVGQRAAAPATAPAVQPGRAVPSIGGGTLAPAMEDGFHEVGDGEGVFGYFRRCITVNYANFRGRARRKEFWSFALFSFVALAVLAVVGMGLDFAAGNLNQVPSDADFSASGAPWFTFVVAFLGWAALIIPSLAVTVRRIHDIGLSGWFILVNFIPSVGSLIILVFTLIPSQRNPNKWGAIPAGVRV